MAGGMRETRSKRFEHQWKTKVNRGNHSKTHATMLPVVFFTKSPPHSLGLSIATSLTSNVSRRGTLLPKPTPAPGHSRYVIIYLVFIDGF